jgi:hypothetical protein
MHKKNSADKVSFVDHTDSSKSAGWSSDSSRSDSLIKQIENTSFEPTSETFPKSNLFEVQKADDFRQGPNVI